jgi:hypothetical protein
VVAVARNSRRQIERLDQQDLSWHDQKTDVLIINCRMESVAVVIPWRRVTIESGVK